jgi:hypothetical protein
MTRNQQKHKLKINNISDGEVGNTTRRRKKTTDAVGKPTGAERGRVGTERLCPERQRSATKGADERRVPTVPATTTRGPRVAAAPECC